MSTKKARKETLRQRMRAKADAKITEIENIVLTGVDRALEEVGVSLDAHDVMRMYGNPKIKYLREQAVIALANQYEDELEALYNRQQDLLPKETKE